MYQLLLKPRAQKDLDKLPPEAWERVRDAILSLADEPRPHRCKKLRGGSYRIRVGNYRVIYDIDDNAQAVTILRTGHRKDVYRSL